VAEPAETVAAHVPASLDLSAGRYDRRLDLSRALGHLRPRDRAMLWLAYALGASHREIAEVVNVDPSSVKTLLMRARRRLAARLRPARGGGS
jgi:RNA polymerase sigma-70 factor (ECF subfamily)